MNRLLLLLLLITTSASAQSSLTLSFEGNGLSHTGVRFKYAHDFTKFQLAAYGTAAKGGLLEIGDQRWSSINGVAGISLNRYYDSAKGNPKFYYGVSIESMVHNFYARTGRGKYTNVAILAGPQFGMNIFLSQKLYFNAEWGARVGINFANTHKNIFRGNILVESFYARENTSYIYLPTSIGITYRLGRISKPKPVAE